VKIIDDQTRSHGHNGEVPRPLRPEQVAQARASRPGPQEIVDLADVFSLLGDPGRVSALTALLAGRRAVGTSPP